MDWELDAFLCISHRLLTAEASGTIIILCDIIGHAFSLTYSLAICVSVWIQSLSSTPIVFEPSAKQSCNTLQYALTTVFWLFSALYGHNALSLSLHRIPASPIHQPFSPPYKRIILPPTYTRVPQTINPLHWSHRSYVFPWATFLSCTIIQFYRNCLFPLHPPVCFPRSCMLPPDVRSRDAFSIHNSLVLINENEATRA